MPEAFNLMYQLEMSCQAQVDVMTARAIMIVPNDDVMAHTAHLYKPETRRPYGILEWPVLRLLHYEADSRIPAFDS